MVPLWDMIIAIIKNEKNFVIHQFRYRRNTTAAQHYKSKVVIYQQATSS